MNRAEESCPLCGGHLERDVRPQVYRYKDAEISLEVAGSYCTDCGEPVLEPADIKALARRYAEFRATIDAD